ncbi:unnamed protein product, partial [marine sediment metagenome]
ELAAIETKEQAKVEALERDQAVLVAADQVRLDAESVAKVEAMGRIAHLPTKEQSLVLAKVLPVSEVAELVGQSDRTVYRHLEDRPATNGVSHDDG